MTKPGVLSFVNVSKFGVAYELEELVKWNLTYLVELIDREFQVAVENAAEVYKEEVIARLNDNAVLGTTELREIDIDIQMIEESDIKGWKSVIIGDSRLLPINWGSRPHYIPRNFRTMAYAKAYGIPFEAFRAGIAKHGTKGINILEQAEEKAMMELEDGIYQIVYETPKVL